MIKFKNTLEAGKNKLEPDDAKTAIYYIREAWKEESAQTKANCLQ